MRFGKIFKLVTHCVWGPPRQGVDGNIRAYRSKVNRLSGDPNIVLDNRDPCVPQILYEIHFVRELLMKSSSNYRVRNLIVSADSEYIVASLYNW